MNVIIKEIIGGVLFVLFIGSLFYIVVSLREETVAHDLADQCRNDGKMEIEYGSVTQIFHCYYADPVNKSKSVKPVK